MSHPAQIMHLCVSKTSKAQKNIHRTVVINIPKNSLNETFQHAYILYMYYWICSTPTRRERWIDRAMPLARARQR